MVKEIKDKNPNRKKRKQEEEGAAGGAIAASFKADPPASSSNSSKRKKGKHEDGKKEEEAPPQSSHPPVSASRPSFSTQQAGRGFGRGSGRGNGRGRGGHRRDHGGFRPSQSLQEEEVSRRYRDATTFLPSSSFSAPSSASFDDFFRGVCILGQQAASASMTPVATSSPQASRPQRQDRGGSRPGPQQRHQGAPPAPQPPGQQGAAPSRR